MFTWIEDWLEKRQALRILAHARDHIWNDRHDDNWDHFAAKINAANILTRLRRQIKGI